MMQADLETSIALLESTPDALNGMLRNLPVEWTHNNEGEKSWSVFDIVGHLIHSDLGIWIFRAKWILEHGESQPFPVFDREGHRQLTSGKSLSQLLDEFALIRAKKLNELRAMNLKTGDFNRVGKHGVLGAVTVGQVISTWPAHDLNHLHQISRVMAYQYREAVGPMQKFLGVMHCDGHGA